jgi:hypothetical protein
MAVSSPFYISFLPFFYHFTAKAGGCSLLTALTARMRLCDRSGRGDPPRQLATGVTALRVLIFWDPDSVGKSAVKTELPGELPTKMFR